jgi:hypothetical protein
MAKAANHFAILRDAACQIGQPFGSIAASRVTKRVDFVIEVKEKLICSPSWPGHSRSKNDVLSERPCSGHPAYEGTAQRLRYCAAIKSAGVHPIGT